MLSSYGFVAEAPELGRGRERFWRAVHRSTWFGVPPPGTPERELGEVYTRMVATIYAENLQRWVDEAGDWPQEWVSAANLSDTVLRLTAAETEQLTGELIGVLETWRDRTDQRPPAAEGDPQRLKVSAMFLVFPRRGQLDQVIGQTDRPVEVDRTEETP